MSNMVLRDASASKYILTKKISVYLYLSLLVVETHIFTKLGIRNKLLLILKESKARATLHVTLFSILVEIG